MQKRILAKEYSRMILSAFLMFSFVLSGINGFFLERASAVVVVDEIDICHATGNPESPYEKISVDKNATAGGHDCHENDIIPPYEYEIWEKTGVEHECPPKDHDSWVSKPASGHYCTKTVSSTTFYAPPLSTEPIYGWVTYQYPGKNWDADGQAIWNNGCKIPGDEPECLTDEDCEGDYICVEGQCVQCLLGEWRCIFFGEDKGGPAWWTQECVGKGVWQNKEECPYGCEDGECLPKPNDLPVCDPEVNLINNGSFEDPVVTNNNGDWQLYQSILGWELVAGDYIELQRGVFASAEGEQHLELDSHGANSASAVEQEFETISGQNYQLIFAWSPRPDQGAADSEVNVEVRSENNTVLLGDTIISGSGSIDWQYETYYFTAEESKSIIKFSHGGPMNTYGGLVDDVQIYCQAEEEPDTVTIVAHKIVCEDESYLPNWGAVKSHGNPIDKNTAQNFLDEVNVEKEVCWLEQGWEFEWGPQNSGYAGDDHIGYAGGSWVPFGPTNESGFAQAQIGKTELTNIGSRIEMREVLQEGYIPFTYETSGNNNSNDFSAEFYCHNDVMNYDNWEWINNPELGETYHCVAFNTPKKGEITVYKKFENLPDMARPEHSQFGFMVNGDGPYYFIENPVTINIPYGSYEITEVDSGENWKVSYSEGCEGVMGYSNEVENDFQTLALINGNTLVNNGVNEVENGNENGLTCIITNTWQEEEDDPEEPRRTFRGGSGITVISEEEPEGEVLGEAIEAECGIYLHEYIRLGANNNPEEVRKLQRFLNEHMNENLAVTGIYSEVCRDAVNRFQLAYKEEVLRPWVLAGLHDNENNPTGYVYKTTKRWINMIMCPELNLPMPDFSEDKMRLAYSPEHPGDVLGEETEWMDEDMYDEEGIWEEESPEFLLDEEIQDDEDEAEEREEEREEQETNQWVLIGVLAAILAAAGIIVYGFLKNKKA